MNIEFHYYVNYIIAAFAGFGPEFAYKIAYASQQVDDNHTHFKIYSFVGDHNYYRNEISYSLDIATRDTILMYLKFHFLPGDPGKNLRKDGATHILNTTPDSQNADYVLTKALGSGNPYMIGIASHVFSDTWAHQNFIGIKHKYNAIPGIINTLIPNIGHADVLSAPDQIGRIWYDTRLKQPIINNNERMLEAASRLFHEYSRALGTNIRSSELKRTKLLNYLKHIFGAASDSTNFVYHSKTQSMRIKAYKDLLAEIINKPVRQYSNRDWQNESIYYSNLDGRYYWRHTDPRKNNWYKLQEAVKEYKKSRLVEKYLAKI